MGACEPCWAEASRRALLRGGVASDYYREVLAEWEPEHGPGSPDDRHRPQPGLEQASA